MAGFLDDILQQPANVGRSLRHTLGAGRAALDAAAALVRSADQVLITGIGSSWHAGMAIESLFAAQGKGVRLVDAAELLYFGEIPKGAVVIALSRSGQSVEIVRLLEMAKRAGASVIAITNAPESPLGRGAQILLRLETAFDNNVSVTMYTAIALVGGLLAAATAGGITDGLADGLEELLNAAGKWAPRWLEQIKQSTWVDASLPTYFLARGPGAATCYEARLLWEEAAKCPATAMTTGGFRHGPQEILGRPVAIGLWLDQQTLRSEDRALAADLRTRGAKVMLVGQNLPESAGDRAGIADLAIDLPRFPDACRGWQFLIDIIPAQLAAWRMAALRKVDPDNFLICPYVITTEAGLPAAQPGKQA